VPLLAVIFVQPFISLMWAVAYLRITGQSTADMLQPGLAPPMAPRTV
jgi:hypothetical protein